MSRPAAITDPAWHQTALNIIEHIARTKGTVTSEDLRREHEPPENANHIGMAFKVACARKIIVPYGFRASRDKSRRGGAIRIWALHPSLEEKGSYESA